MDFGSKDCAERYCGHGGRRLCEVWRLNEDSQASVPWLSMSRAMEMENPLEPVVEDKEETCQDDRGDVVAGGRDKLPNAIPSAPPLLDFLSSSPLPRWARTKLELDTSGNGTSELGEEGVRN